MKIVKINTAQPDTMQAEQFILELVTFVSNVEKEDKLLLSTPDANYNITVKKKEIKQ